MAIMTQNQVTPISCTIVAITPALAKQIRKAREEYSRAETTRCETPEQMQQFFDSL